MGGGSHDYQNHMIEVVMSTDEIENELEELNQRASEVAE